MREVFAVLLIYAASIDNPRVLGSILGDIGGEPFPDLGVYFLRLFGRGNFTCAYGPVEEEDSRQHCPGERNRRYGLREDNTYQTGSYAITILDQSFVRSATAFS